MRHVISALLGFMSLCVATEAMAVPATIAFAGRLSTANGPVTGNVTLTFSLHAGATGGTALWTETHAGVAATAGLVYADLGTLTTLDETDLGNGPLFLEIVVSGETLSPRLPIRSVPFAIRAEVANRADTLGTIAPADVVTTVAGGGGITANRTGNGVTLGASTSVLQARVTGTCGANTSIASISAAGLVTCEPDDNTTYSAVAGGGLALGGTGFGLTTCASGQVLKAGASPGTWACAIDANSGGTITGITTAAGSGLTGGTSSGTATLAIAAGGIGTAHLASGAVTMANTEAPVGFGNTASGANVVVSAPLTLIAVGASFTPTSAGFCVVNVVSNTDESSPSGWASLGVGYRANGSQQSPPNPHGDIFTTVAGQSVHSASNTAGFAVTAGVSYAVGCLINYTMGSSFGGNTYSCAASWICS